MPKSITQPTRALNYSSLVRAIKATTTELQGRAAAAVNQALVLRNWLVGAYIVEYEQAGKDRAKYGTKLLESLAADLKKRQVKGLSDPRVLRDCRSLYLTYPQIRGSVTRELERHSAPAKSSETKVIGLLMDSSDRNSTDGVCRIVEKASNAIRGSVTRELPTPLPASAIFCLSWTKLQELLAIDDPWKRAFFENECLKANWSVRQLQRQIGSLLCSDRENVVVEYATAGLDNKLFVSRYLTALPSAEKLRAFLEADRDRIESLMPASAPPKKNTKRKKGVR